MIRFGSMSIALLCGALYGLLRAAMLCSAPVNQGANRLLAALLLVLALYTAPYIIGYAGYYDAYPWLTFAPYDLTLAIGPLLYLYLRCLRDGGAQLAPRWGLHLLPALLQFAYFALLFMQPLHVKHDWDARIHAPYVAPLLHYLALAALAAYGALAWRDRHAAPPLLRDWMRNVRVALGLTLAFWCLLAAVEVVTGGLNYFQRFPFYAWLALLIGYLGTDGYRYGMLPDLPDLIQMPASLPTAPVDPDHASHATTAAPAAPVVSAADPVKPDLAHAEPLVQAASTPGAAEQGARWHALLVQQAWWRDPDLTLPLLAQRLGTNTTALSRALNAGLGMNFNEVINQLRVDAVLAALRADDGATPVLTLALAAGFNSKASFNRAFKLYTGDTPSAYRRRLQQATADKVASSGR